MTINETPSTKWPELPKGVPPLVREQALLFWYDERNIRRRSKILALASGAGMAKVWGELLKCNRKTKRYLHPARSQATMETEIEKLRGFVEWRNALDALELTEPNAGETEAQHQALLYLYREAVELALYRRPDLLSRQEAKRRAKPFLKLEPHLREAAALLKRYDRYKPEQVVLEELADVFRNAGLNDWRSNTYFTATDAFKDAPLRAFVIAIAQTSRKLFGSDMLKSLATISATAFGVQITDDKVRSILKSRIESVDS